MTNEEKNNDLKWYIVNTHSGYENKAKIALMERIKAAKCEHEFGEILVPMETVVDTKKGEKKTSTRKFFPGYMLVQMNLTTETWHIIKATPKISGFVGSGTNPPAMSEKEVEKIRKSMNTTLEKTDVTKDLDVGNTVRVLEGPFINFTGTVEQVDREKSRLCVLVSILGRVVFVELEFVQVEKVDA